MRHDALPSPGDIIDGKYRLESLLANGGMAAVFSGEHLTLGHRIAVKILLPESAMIETAVERFMREARAAARVQTEHVTRMIDAGMLEGGLPYLVMELLEGQDLGAVLGDQGPLPYAEVVDLVLEALEGLAHVHAVGVVHRDLKPSNLFRVQKPDGSTMVKVLDFGVSKALGGPMDGAALRLTGNALLGSPVYMSPEQIRSAGSVDVRSDVWSIAVALYELVTGVLPFSGEGIGEALAQILEGKATLMRALKADVPEGLDAVVMRCFEHAPDRRYQDVAELAKALIPFGDGGGEERVRRIEATLLHVPIRQAAMSVGAMPAFRSTHLERSSAVIVPPGQRRDGSGEFALSRTYVDAGATDSRARLRRMDPARWTAAAAAAMTIVVVFGGGVAWVHSALRHAGPRIEETASGVAGAMELNALAPETSAVIDPMAAPAPDPASQLAPAPATVRTPPRATAVMAPLVAKPAARQSLPRAVGRPTTAKSHK